MNPRRITLTLSAAAGGLLAAAFLPMAVAAADEIFYTPDDFSFMQLSPSLTGFTPSPLSLPPLFDQVTGSEAFNVFDTTTGISPDAMFGDVLTTNFLGGVDVQFDESGDISSVPGVLDIGSQINFLEAPFLGFINGNELILSDSVPGGLEDILFTISGAFTLF